jgi:hypothetical protein
LFIYREQEASFFPRFQAAARSAPDLGVWVAMRALVTDATIT